MTHEIYLTIAWQTSNWQIPADGLGHIATTADHSDKIPVAGAAIHQWLPATGLERPALETVHKRQYVLDITGMKLGYPQYEVMTGNGHVSNNGKSPK